MTTVATRVRRISDLEGFDIVVRQNGAHVAVTQNGLLGPYNFARKARAAKTVNAWKDERFKHTYPGFDCDVLMEDGSVAAGQTLLRTVRESYEEQE